jgi:hypothetical protein
MVVWLLDRLLVECCRGLLYSLLGLDRPHWEGLIRLACWYLNTYYYPLCYKPSNIEQLPTVNGHSLCHFQKVKITVCAFLHARDHSSKSQLYVKKYKRSKTWEQTNKKHKTKTGESRVKCRALECGGICDLHIARKRNHAWPREGWKACAEV